MAKNNQIKELIGKDLKGFKLVKMNEVYCIDLNDLKKTSLRFFTDPTDTKTFTKTHRGSCWQTSGHDLVLTNGTVSYVIGKPIPVQIFKNKSELKKIQKKAAAKLSPAERNFLGFK